MAMAASSSTENKNSVPIKEKTMQYYLYPPPIARYEDVITSPKLFMDTLGNFHAAMGTKFKIPIVGGKDLDLHRLFMEVTSRGGIKRVLEDKKWREVTNSFSFPPSATNASFILRKYYMSLIHHFEQVYYFKAKAWTPVPTDTWQSTKSTLTSTSGMNKAVLPLPETQTDSLKRQRTMTEENSLSEPSIGFPVTGIIDGKFESGYLCTVRIGGEQLQGVLYQTMQTPSYEIPKNEGLVTTVTPVRRRRRRRKKSEMRKRDPAHPKPNRSGYNFFFAEQHARLKLLHPGKDRDISRMIGELWNKLTEPEKAVYQEKAVKDKERYRIEMERYREGLRTGQILRNAVPLTADTNIMLVENAENNGENDPASGYSDNDKSSFEDEEKITEKVEMEAETVESFNVEDEHEHEHSVFLDEPIQKKSIFLQENEPVMIENDSKLDGMSLSDEHKTKSADNQDKVLEKFDEIVENGPLSISENKVGNESEPFDQEKLLDFAEKVEKDSEVFQETDSAMREGCAREEKDRQETMVNN